MRELWIPTPKEVAAIRKMLEDYEATIASLRAEVAALKKELLQLGQRILDENARANELEAELKGRGTWAIVDGLNQRID